MLSLAKEVWAYLRVRKKFWMVPMLLVLGLFGAVLLFAEASPVAPFIYSLF